ncbi:hypothetical protein L2E82_28848 [Cichorium intybus]|uniref:Uncharacterized protein n=1 Tax=Cichorium intybus TaxID=13427 RepID=A0ACB9CWU7_CICIN|nr:hypothetical protein L2E82_28848 [Cichorium intybus]
MNWLLQTEDSRLSTGIQYQSSKSYMDFLEELTYEHVNFIFSDATYPQENAHSTINTYAYKFGYSEPETLSYSYYDYGGDYPIYNQTMRNNEYARQLDVNQRTTIEHTQQDEHLSSSFHVNPTECLERNHNPGVQVWEDNVDLDNMTYEELIELGEIVGSQSRGLSHEAISLLPISKFKCGFFWRKKSRDERCVICQMEYKRGDRQITLPCKHVYHASCGSRWLSINKACPVCYKDVHVCVSKSEERFRKWR